MHGGKPSDCSAQYQSSRLGTLLWYRILVAMDRVTSFGLGRPCAVQDEELVYILMYPVCNY